MNTMKILFTYGGKLDNSDSKSIKMKGHLENEEDAMKRILEKIKLCEYFKLTDDEKTKNQNSIILGDCEKKYCKKKI